MTSALDAEESLSTLRSLAARPAWRSIIYRSEPRNLRGFTDMFQCHSRVAAGLSQLGSSYTGHTRVGVPARGALAFLGGFFHRIVEGSIVGLRC
jgi:hypothetical protein